jgi:hypothetical protein
MKRKAALTKLCEGRAELYASFLSSGRRCARVDVPIAAVPDAFFCPLRLSMGWREEEPE